MVGGSKDLSGLSLRDVKLPVSERDKRILSEMDRLKRIAEVLGKAKLDGATSLSGTLEEIAGKVEILLDREPAEETASDLFKRAADAGRVP